MNLLWDLDGVLRDLGGEVFSNIEIDSWDMVVDGLSLCDKVENNLWFLYTAPPTKYFDTIIEKTDMLDIITYQKEHWRPLTVAWCEKYIGRNKYNLFFVDDFKEKLYLMDKDSVLIDDFPFFADYTNVAVVDYKYNKDVKNPLIRIETVTQMDNFLQKYKEAA